MTADEKLPTYLRSHRLRDNLIRVELGPEAEALLAQAGAAPAGRSAKTVVKEGPLRVTLAALRREVALDEHQVTGPVSIQVLQGRLRLITGAGDIDLQAGEVAVLEAGVAHAARALDDCVLLITVALR